MIEVSQVVQHTEKVSLTNEAAKAVTLRYLENLVLGDGCYVTEEGRLEHWTSYPHGSGTTTDLGYATPMQLAAWKLIQELEKVTKK